jgi:excisionase family DNA binding protein
MPQLVPVDEAARRLGIGRSTVFRYIRLGLLDAHRRHLDRRTYVDLDQLRELRESPPFRNA